MDAQNFHKLLTTLAADDPSLSRRDNIMRHVRAGRASALDRLDWALELLTETNSREAARLVATARQDRTRRSALLEQAVAIIDDADVLEVLGFNA